jgi:[protein-PII] uridylyltransferase
MQTLELSLTEKENRIYLLKITVPQNEKGIIYKVTAVLFAHSWDIMEAIAEIVEGGMVKDVFLIRSIDSSKLSLDSLNQIKSELKLMFEEEVDVLSYLKKYQKDPNDYKRKFSSSVNIFNPSSIDSTVLDIRTYDRPGLLFEISYLLYLEEIDIISVTAKSEDKEIRDSFLLRTTEGEKLSEEACLELKNKFLEIL